MAEFYRGRGKKEDEKKLIAMLDNVFFLDDDEAARRDFLTLLPKLYKSKYNPAYNNLCVMQDGEFKAAVGLYPSVADACGKKLKIGGIGNVAVARDARRMGYMKECMNMCLDVMKNDGTDYSLLGGQRQRYGYFGYEPAGTGYSFGIDKTNIRHTCGADYKGSFTSKKLEAQDREILEKINALYGKSAFHIERDIDSLFDILHSWDTTPYAAFKGEEFKGYFSLGNDGGIAEFKPLCADDIIDLALCVMDITGKDSVWFGVPQGETGICEKAMRICSRCEMSHCEMLNIFNFGNFIEGFLKVKASRMQLCDGELVLLIHGIKRDEKLLISVKDNSVSVAETDKAPDAELEHKEAIRMTASIYSEARLKLPAFAQTWFPVDFYSHSLDNV